MDHLIDYIYTFNVSTIYIHLSLIIYVFVSNKQREILMSRLVVNCYNPLTTQVPTIVTEFLVKPANRVPIRPYRFAILFRIGTRKFVHNSLVTAYQHMRSSPEEICLLHMKDEGSRQNRKKTYKETQKKLWERRGQNRTEKKLEEFVASAKRNRSDKALFAIEDEFNSS
jgi:hypothetical protein